MNTSRSPQAATRRRLPPRIADERIPAPAIVDRPDGYYWIGETGLGEFGPFESYELARADRDAGVEDAVAASQALQEAEIAMGIAPWPHPLARPPGEQGSSPRLQEE